MERALRARLRPALSPSFLLVRVSWACLLAALALAALDFPGGKALFAIALLPGWLLSFVLGVLQRIVPFLASVHAGRAGASALTPVRLLAAHRALHLAALALLVAAALSGAPALAAAGAACGLAGAAAFATFFVFVLFKARHGIQPPHQPAPA
jgi:hypothetical protein